MRDYSHLQPLPCGEQDFALLREQNCLYIDKTDFVYKLAHDISIKAAFLGRPRRFGKSLFLSTLDYYYQGRKDLFEGLKIMELEKEWKKYEVLRFDLSGSNDKESFCIKIDSRLAFYEEQYGYEARDRSLGTRLSRLIHTASKLDSQRVVLLFDEYDSALQSTLYNDIEHEKVRAEYRNFFAVLKEESLYIRKIVITGIMKFTQLSLFSTLNNVMTISADNDYASACGFTHEELRNDFKPYMERLAEANGFAIEEVYGQIIERYDGYCFSECMTKVINPFSLLNALKNNKLGSYWSYSGATKYIMDCIDNSDEGVIDWENASVGKDKLENSDADKDDLRLSLYQTGYLTIKGQKPSGSYILSVPNIEVKEAISNVIIPRLVDKTNSQADTVRDILLDAFVEGDLETFMQNLQSLVAGTPYSQDNTVKAIEDRFQFILTTIFHFCGLNPQSEVMTASGRIDIVCKTKWRNVIFELKMTSNGGLESASEQIAERHYALPYLSDKQLLSTVAVEFDAEKKLLTRWRINHVKS